MDFSFNGKGSGAVANKLLASNFDISCLRPWIGRDGKAYITTMENGGPKAQPIHNAEATLTKDAWKILDDAVIKAAKPRLRAVADLRGAGLQLVIPNGMGKTVLETQVMGDINDASMSMDGLAQGENDRPLFDLTALPLPIIHKSFSYSARQIQASRNGGSPLDTSTAELAARRVAEQAEKLLLGVADSYTFGGGTIYGYTNFPNSVPVVLTAPTYVDLTPETLLTEVLEMRQAAQDVYHFGPYVLYFSSAWDRYLDEDYKANSDKTLRNRIKEIDNIGDARTLDYLTGYQSLLVQMTSDVVREVIGMDFTTLQWEAMGGLLVNFMVMAIMVPQLRADKNGNAGIVHGNVA